MNAFLPAMVVANLEKLPALPEVVMDLLDYLQQANVDAGKVAQKIARDPALAARLLRVANSSFYGLQGRVATVNDALVVLGLRAARALVTAAAVINHIETLADGGDRRAFWRHSGATALCARSLARLTGANPEGAYTAGLLHDIGRIALLVRFPGECRNVRAWRDRQDAYLLDAEREVLGFDHAQVGGALARLWKFPPEIEIAIAGHHTPAEQPATSLSDIVHVADILAHALDFFGAEDDPIPCLSHLVWRRLGLDWIQIKQLLAEVDRQRDDVDLVLG